MSRAVSLSRAAMVLIDKGRKKIAQDKGISEDIITTSYVIVHYLRVP